jgi:hypothetical protein
MIASFVVPAIMVGDPDLVQRLMHEDRNFSLIISFVFYFLNYLVIIFFNSAIVACANIRMGGGDPTVFDGLNTASSRIVKIVLWAFVSATVGMILRMIQGRSNLIGRTISGLLGIAWSVTSYLVIPVMVNENKGPFDAYIDSIDLLKKTWGEGLIGTLSFGLVFTIASLPAIIVMVAGAYLGNGLLTIALIISAVLYLVVLSIFQSALMGIFQSALYQFARFGKVPWGFHERQLRHAIERKV